MIILWRTTYCFSDIYRDIFQLYCDYLTNCGRKARTDLTNWLVIHPPWPVRYLETSILKSDPSSVPHGDVIGLLLSESILITLQSRHPGQQEIIHGSLFEILTRVTLLPNKLSRATTTGIQCKANNVIHDQINKTMA